jgi:hypothetical protein
MTCLPNRVLDTENVTLRHVPLLYGVCLNLAVRLGVVSSRPLPVQRDAEKPTALTEEKRERERERDRLRLNALKKKIGRR